MFTAHRSLFIATLLVAALFAGACTSTTSTATSEPVAASNATVDEATATPAPTAIPNPTATPMPTATATALAAATPEPAATESESLTPAASDDQFSDEAIAVFLKNLGDTYNNVEGAWEGFVPNEHPVVVAVRREDRSLIGAIAINHPSPDALGDATALDISGLPFVSAHRIENPVDADRLLAVVNFEFQSVIGGHDSFLINAGTDFFFDLRTKDYASTVIHEMFHRYQGFTFTGFLDVGQDVEGYDYSAANLELATLEERALHAALNARTAEERETAAKYFAAIRLTRIDNDTRNRLDEAQETVEGSARWIEHIAAGDLPGFTYDNTNFDRDLQVLVPSTGVKDVYGFGRWYASGAAGLSLLSTFGVEDFDKKLEQGRSIAQQLGDALGVKQADLAGLVAEARAELDPAGELRAATEAASERVKDEPPIFGDQAGPDDVTYEWDITDEEAACLEAQGVDLESPDDVSDDAIDACFAESAG